MTYDLRHTVVTFPRLKEQVELLALHEDQLIFRTVNVHVCGAFQEYERRLWYHLNLSTGILTALGEGGPLDGECSYSEGKFFFDGCTYVAGPCNDVVKRTLGALVAETDSEELWKGLNAAGIDMKSLYPTTFKLVKSFLGGWSVKVDSGTYSIGDFFVRLNDAAEG